MASESIEVVEVRENKLIGRREVTLRVEHFGKGTPKRLEMREKIAELFKVPLDSVYVRNIKTEYGMNVTWVTAHIYDSSERALEIEPEYIIRRNKPEEKEEGGE